MMRKFLSQSRNTICKSCNNSNNNGTSMLQFQKSNKHFVIIQWPNNEVSLKIDNRKTAQEHEEFYNDLSQYAESQVQRLHNLKPKQTRPVSSPLEYSHQPSRQLDALLSSNKTSHHKAPCSYSVQLNSVSMIDPSLLKSTSVTPVAASPSLVGEQEVLRKNLKQGKTKSAKNTQKNNINVGASFADSSVQQQLEQKILNAKNNVDFEQLMKKNNEMFVVQEVKRQLMEQEKKQKKAILLKQQEQQAEKERVNKVQQQEQQNNEEDTGDLSQEQQAMTTEETSTSVTC